MRTTKGQVARYDTTKPLGAQIDSQLLSFVSPHSMSHPSDASVQRLSARITGRVQGVGFRHFTRTTAQRNGLTGWVRNEPDGSVRLEAEGPRTDLESLLDAVHTGPRSARVESVDAKWDAATDAFSQFEVRYA